MVGFMNDELIKIRDNLECGHCKSKFKGSDSQSRKVKYEKMVVYCSGICRSASHSKKATEQALREGKTLRKGVLRPACPVCNKKFESRYDKKYCSLECYNKSPEFISMAKNNMEKGRKTSSVKWAEKMKKICPVCSKEFRADRSKRKFCSQLCARKFRADLFDSWIANPQHITLPQCYDEFMLQNELPCLVDGCDWKGQHLSIHLNNSHGIRADDFKRAAGFNLHTGLIAPKLSKKLSKRAKVGVALTEYDKTPKNEPKKIRNYKSLEGKEHAKKARMLAGEGQKRICEGCGVEFTQSTPFGKALYCTKECRNKSYAKNRKKKV